MMNIFWLCLIVAIVRGWGAVWARLAAIAIHEEDTVDEGGDDDDDDDYHSQLVTQSASSFPFPLSLLPHPPPPGMMRRRRMAAFRDDDDDDDSNPPLAISHGLLKQKEDLLSPFFVHPLENDSDNLRKEASWVRVLVGGGRIEL